MVTMFFTAAGHKGDHVAILSAAPVFLRQPTGWTAKHPFGEWSTPVEIFAADGTIYRPADQNEGEPGKIKAFRDPAHYRDRDGNDFVLFTGSSASKPGPHDGVIGLAAAKTDGGYRLEDPLVDATQVNNELERPHIVEHDGLLYLFWSTQRGVFAPGIEAPTGLYGATAETLDGPWTLLNETGLVIANPARAADAGLQLVGPSGPHRYQLRRLLGAGRSVLFRNCSHAGHDLAAPLRRSYSSLSTAAEQVWWQD